jgi:hypothetical protein
LPWQQGFNFVDWLSICDFGENIPEVGFGIHVVQFCRLDEALDSGGAVAAGIGACEEMIFTAYGDAAHGVFGDIIVHLQAAVRDESR